MKNRRRKMIYKIYDEQCMFFWSWRTSEWIPSEAGAVMACARSKRSSIRLAAKLYEAGGVPILRQLNDVSEGDSHWHKERKRWVVDASVSPACLRRLDRFGG